MRLRETERQAIVDAVHEAFGPASRAYLFGSRTDDRKFGGDIDVLIEIGEAAHDTIAATIRASALLKLRIGERKIDLVVTDGSLASESRLIVRKAREQGIAL